MSQRNNTSSLIRNREESPASALPSVRNPFHRHIALNILIQRNVAILVLVLVLIINGGAG